MGKMKLTGKTFILAAAFAAFLLPPLSGAARAQGFGGGGQEIPPDIMDIVDMFNERLRHRITPAITDVAVGEAKAGEPIDVTVSAGYDDDRAIDKVAEAAVYYSIDGGASFKGPMALDAAGDGIWKGQIPAMQQPGEIMIQPWVKDSFGNVSTHLGCSATKWPPFEDACSLPGATDLEPVDDPRALIEDDYDIWEIRLSADADYVYLQQNLEGEASKGQLSPRHINAYAAMVVDTTELYEIDDILSFMPMDVGMEPAKNPQFVNMVFYAPLAGAIGGDKFSGCSLMGFKDGKPDMDAESVTCEPDGSDLFIRIKRGILHNPDAFTVIGALTGFIEGEKGFIPSFRELTAMTRIEWRPHVFQVK